MQAGLGLLLRRLAPGEPPPPPAAPPTGGLLERYAELIVRPPAPMPSTGALPAGTCAPVARWRVLRPLMLVHAEPWRSSPVVEVVFQKDFVWSCEQARPASASAAEAAAEERRQAALGAGWRRVACRDGWVAPTCPAGHAQLEPASLPTTPSGQQQEQEQQQEEGGAGQRQEEAPARFRFHAAGSARELEALEMYVQARIAAVQTYGMQGITSLGPRFSAWEAEAVGMADEVNRDRT